MKKAVFYIINFLWALPQNLLGLIVFLWTKMRRYPTYIQSNGIILTNWQSYAGLSLGIFNFTHRHANDNTLKHEYGHTLQSVACGPLWLVVFGLPSLIWAGVHKFSKKSYYDFYTEKLADKLSGVHR